MHLGGAATKEAFKQRADNCGAAQRGAARGVNEYIRDATDTV
jgi:hypothetical protein